MFFLSWIIESNQQLEYDIDKHNPYWLTNDPSYNISICTKLHGTVFKKYIINARTYISNHMCSIGVHWKHQP